MTGGLIQMIQMLSTEELTIELFDAYAPHMKIKRLDLGTNSAQRASCIFSEMERFANKHPAEHNAVFKVLNTIGIVNGDTTSFSLIMSYLDQNEELHEVYNSLKYARTFNKRHPVAAMAAFIAIQCKSEDEAVSYQAKRLWQQFIRICSKAAQGNYIHVAITSPTKSFEERAAGIAEFQEDLENYVRKINQQKNYIALVVPNQTTEGYTRYYVNTSPPDRDVLMVQNGKPVFGSDMNMTGFEIRHYFVKDRVWISETKAGDPRHILDLFLKDVLGSQVESQRKRDCGERMHVFRDEKTFKNEIRLPKDLSTTGEKVYVSEMEIVVSESHENFALEDGLATEYLPTTFRGTSTISVYDQIGKLLKDRFPSDLWNLKKVVLSAKLHPYVYDDDGDVSGRSIEYTEVNFPIRPGGCTPVLEKKLLRRDRLLWQDALRLRSLWGLDGTGCTATAKND